MDPEVLAAIVGPLLTALLAGGAFLARETAARRRREGDRDDVVERRQAQVAFLDTWLSAHAHVREVDPHADARARQALADLDALYREQAVDLRTPPVRREAITLGRMLRALLRIPVRGALAVLLRSVYWLLLFAAVVMIAATLASYTASGEGVVFDIAVAMVVTIAWVIPAAVFAGLTTLADHRARRRSTPTDTTPVPPSAPSAPFVPSDAYPPAATPPPGWSPVPTAQPWSTASAAEVSRPSTH